MKVLAFDADLSKIDQVGQALASSPNLAVSSSSRGNLEITIQTLKRHCLYQLLLINWV